MEPVLYALIDWIASHSDLDTTDLPIPAVVEMSAEALTRELYAEAPRMLPSDGVDERVFALYGPDAGPHGTIYILDAQTVAGDGEFSDPRDNPIWREILLHELVHHIQWQSGEAATWPCRNAGEREAYLLGGEYLRATATEDPMPNRRFLAHLYARC